MINFNSSALYVLPSYYVQQVLSQTLGQHLVRMTLQLPSNFSSNSYLNLTASMESRRAGPEERVLVHLHVINYREVPSALFFELEGFPEFHSTVEVTTLWAPFGNVGNDLEHPQRVHPAQSQLTVPTPQRFEYTVKEWSLTVLTLSSLYS